MTHTELNVSKKKMTAVFANRLLFLKWLKNGAEMFSNRLVHHKKNTKKNRNKT
jgi:hypothetical protein